ncbi:hypothetical protein Acr_13g0007280 [Actinidia rufa]|uniref:Transposase (putative) gypsy type domain-containing protein n=1 Tax=Actinidia rufa TaxID=165716 RepID=A0A7J0FN15_9ERIC|nr:hypothetical protein Acr_13g0007280 [Actinidia rufa]
MEGSPALDTNLLASIHPSVEEKTNIMTLEELNALKETYSFPSRVRVRLPEEGDTIISARPSDVAFYEAAFPAGLRFPIHPTIRLILQFYNICPAQLVPNAWKSIACSMAMWRVFKYTLSLFEFRNMFSLKSNPKPDQGWLYFKARNKKTLLGGYPSNVKGWKSKFFFVSGDEWEFLEGSSREGAPRVPKTWGIPDKHCNNPPRLYGDEPKVFEAIFRSVEKIGHFLIPVLLESKSFRRVFVFPGSMASGTAGEGRPGAMSKRIGFKKLGEKLGKLAIGKVNDGSKGKGVDREPEGKKKATSSSKALTTPATASLRPGEGTSANLSTVSSPTTSILGSPSMAEKLLRGVIPRADKEKVEKLTLDQTATKLFHVIGQAMVLSSSLAVWSREAGEHASLQEGRAASMETEVTRLQKLSTDLEQQLAEARVREQQANDELAKTKSDRDSLADKFTRSGVLVVELREALDKDKESAVEEFKSSSEFVVAVEDSASKYFGEGFDFCKVQLRRHHPDLAIDLEGTVVDQDLLAEQDEAAEEKEKEKVGKNEGVAKKIAPL